jgi:hypothetical protein
MMRDDGEDDFNLIDLLSGSLMNDLLADLNSGTTDGNDSSDNNNNDWLNLEHLEQELNRMTSLQQQQQENAPYYTASSAAGRIVSAQLQQQLAILPPSSYPYGGVPTTTSGGGTTATTASSAMDAWSLSLQKFTAMSSLEADFLQADASMKQQASTGPGGHPSTAEPNQTGGPPGLASAAPQAPSHQYLDYDVTERPVVVLVPPPGLAADHQGQNHQQVLTEAAARLSVLPQVQETEEFEEDFTGVMPKPLPHPVTPQNSVGIRSSGPAPTPRNSISAPTPQPTPVTVKPISVLAGSPPPMALNGDRVDVVQDQSRMSQPMMMQMMSSPTIPIAVPMAVPLPRTGPAWQTPPPQPQQQWRVFANPHPSAPPIPATALASSKMTARDISFVVHAMLKPILLAENNNEMSLYHLQYWTRHHPVKPPMPKQSSNSTNNNSDAVVVDDESSSTSLLKQELLSRQKKAQAWKDEKRVLGLTAKTNFARPRALISVQSQHEDDADADNIHTSQDEKKQQRAAVWKARIYVDQGYQALAQVVELWSQQQQHGNASVPASVQPHLVKLYKCLGVTVVTSEAGSAPSYTVNVEVLKLLVKLNKGKVLLARTLEMALLPPSLIHVLMPVCIEVLCRTPSSSSPENGDPGDDRVFGAWTGIVNMLSPKDEQDAASLATSLLEAVTAVQRNSESALASTARMLLVHSLLQRGTSFAATNPEFLTQWQPREDAFLQILAGL